MTMTKSKSPWKWNTCLILATAGVFIFVCLALLLAPPSGQSKPTPKPITSLSYLAIRQNQQRLTGVQWDEYEKSITGQRVQWQGTVNEIKPDITGENYVWIDMDTPTDKLPDVYFSYPKDQALTYSKGQPVAFQGDIAGGIEIIFFIVELENAEILP